MSQPDEHVSSSMSHERISINQLSMSRSMPSDTRLGNSNYICFRFRKLEFFCLTAQFVQYSVYFNNLFSFIQVENEAIRHKD